MSTSDGEDVGGNNAGSISLDAASKIATTASNTGNALKMFLSLVGGLIVAAVSGLVWASSLAPKVYVDEQVKAMAAAQITVDNDHDKRLNQIDVRLEKVVTAIEHQTKVNDDVHARLRELESRTANQHVFTADTVKR